MKNIIRKMKRIFILAFLIPSMSQAQLKDFIKKTTESVMTNTTKKNVLDISGGLKEALNKGVTNQVSKLTAMDGFYGNELVKIVLPDELQKVDSMLRKMSMGNLADDGIKALNRAAEDAVKESTPIFVNAIKNITITDAKNILLGQEDAATQFLQTGTRKPLYLKFNPVVQKSIGKVGADAVWKTIIDRYNMIPFVSKVNPDITDYVTNKALDGVFKMIAVEEKDIRTNFDSRTSDLLKKVFALQDKK